MKTFKFFAEVNGNPVTAKLTVKFDSASWMDDAKRVAENLASMDDSCSCEVFDVSEKPYDHVGTYRADSEFIPG